MSLSACLGIITLFRSKEVKVFFAHQLLTAILQPVTPFHISAILRNGISFIESGFEKMQNIKELG